MPETTKTCQVEMHDGKPCGRELYDWRCIFHAYWKDKDAELFQKKLDEIFRDESLKTYDFTGFIFPASIVFPKELSKNVSFKHAKLKGGAHFESTCFKEEADFEGTAFKGKANFLGATFNGAVNFRDAIFEYGANFSFATFENDTYFWEARFKDYAHFTGAVFKDYAGFGGVLFGGEANFGSSSFEHKATFTAATFEDTFVLIGPEKHQKDVLPREVDFRWVTFLKPKKVEFRKVNLSRASFFGTDVREVHFTDVSWYREKGKGRNKLFDEVFPDPKTKKFDYALIAQLYRRLRANYEENLRYSEAGDFYIGEMEMTRKAEKNIFKKLPLLFYKAISNYGESYYRPLGWIVVILLIFPLLFMFGGIQPVSLDHNNLMEEIIHYRLHFSSIESFLPTAEKISDYYTCFLYSMSAFFLIRDKKYTTIDNWGHTLFVLESILSPVTLAFFLLALRRRFKR